MQSTIELVSFKLKADANIALFNDIQQQLNAFVKTQPGFYYRTLVKDIDDTYLDIIHWESEEKSLAAEAKFSEQPWAKDMLSLIEQGSVNMRRVKSLSEIGYND